MTTEDFAPVLQQLAAREGINVTDLYIEGDVVFKRKDDRDDLPDRHALLVRGEGCGRGAGAAARAVNRKLRRCADEGYLLALPAPTGCKPVCWTTTPVKSPASQF